VVFGRKPKLNVPRRFSITQQQLQNCLHARNILSSHLSPPDSPTVIDAGGGHPRSYSTRNSDVISEEDGGVIWYLCTAAASTVIR